MPLPTTAQVFSLPDLGEGLTEAEIIEWRVEVGDVVEIDQVVVVVETAKASVEVPCPFAGRVEALHGSPGEVLPVGQPLITVEPQAGSGNVLIGYGTRAGDAGARRRRVRPPTPPAPPSSGEASPSPSASKGPKVSTGRPEGRARTASGAVRVISPIVRRLAADSGIDLASVQPTGPGGVVLRRDVQARIDVPAAAAPPETGDEKRIPLHGMRRAVADKVSLSRREIPDVTVWVDVDATALLEARAALNQAYPDRKVSVLALVARFTVAALRRFPELNSRFDGAAGEVVQTSAVHLGFAAQTDRGLVVPVVHDAHTMSTLDLADALSQATAHARAGTLTPAQLTGGTFTLNNYGVFGVDGSTPIINHPEAALLGVGRIVDKPWVVDGALAVRSVSQVSLTFDHRVCDGGTAGGFLRYVADCIENPVVVLGQV